MTERDVTQGEHATLVDATRAELARLPERWQNSALASLALGLARRFDIAPTQTSAGGLAAAGLAREVRTTLLEIAKLAPEAAQEDGVDDLQRRRAERRAANG